MTKYERFEWDPAKARVNVAKHGVTFEEAASVFDDERAIFADDDLQTVDEQRFLVFGVSSEVRILTVVHCERESGTLIRIISARRATAREQAFYVGGGQ